MRVSFDIPDAMAVQISDAGMDPARAALEAVAVEGYRSRALSEAEVRRLLSFETRMEVHALLAAHDVPLHYNEEHVRQDVQASDELGAQR
jgi:predicted HTH domain antitoxin